MLINTTQRVNLKRDRQGPDYVAAHQLPNDTIVAEGRNQIDILSSSGDVVHTSSGRNLETNIKGDVFWAEQGNIQKWTPESGETTFAEGYSSFIPGPDGKVFALGYNEEAGRATVDLLGADGKLLSKADLPDKFKIAGAYVSHDQSKALLGGWSDAYYDVYSRDASLFSLEVGENNELKMTRERLDRLNALSKMDYHPILLEDGRVGVFAQGTIRIGDIAEPDEQAWTVLGPSAAPGGRPLSPSDTGAPTVTLSEHLEKIVYDFQGPRGFPEEGTGLWPLMQPRNPDLVDLTPPPTIIPPPEPEPEEKKGFLAKTLGKVFGGGSEEPEVAPVVVEHTPRLVDPKLGSKLKELTDLSEVSPLTFGKAKVTQLDDRMVVEFTSGAALSKTGSGDETRLRVYGPTGDEKKLPHFEGFGFDADAGLLTINETTYDLNNGMIENDWVKIEEGKISAKDRGLTYLGGGLFEPERSSYFRLERLPLQPEFFSESVGFVKKRGSGEVYTQPEMLMGSGASFRSVERVDTLKAPEYGANGALNADGNEFLKSHFRVTFNDGRVLEGDEKSVSLNGKKLEGHRLKVSQHSVTLSQETLGPSRSPAGDKPLAGSRWNRLSGPASEDHGGGRS